MNENLQNTIDAMLNRAIEALNNGADWLAGEIPEVIEQLLIWHFTESLIMFLLGWGAVVFITVASVKIGLKAISDRKAKEPWTCYEWRTESTCTSGAYDFLVVFPWIALAFTWIITIVVIGINGAPSWLKIAVAPKLYLLEYASSLIK